MEEKSEFYKQVETLISEQKNRISPKDYKFYMIDRFLIFSTLVDKYSDDCMDCKDLKKEITKTALNISTLLNRSKTNKIKYEKVNDKIISHLNSKHHYKPKRYYSSLYSLLGLGIGFCLGSVVSFLLYNSFSKIILVFLLAGLLIGNTVGNRKDKDLKKKNLQY